MVKNSPEPTTLVVSGKTTDLAAKVAQHVDICGVRLVDQAARMSQIVDEPPKLRRSVREHRFTRDNDKGVVRVDVAFLFELAENTDESKKNPTVSMRATFAMFYEVKGLSGFSDEEIDAFAKVNGAYNAWPFWREFVYSTMSRMGLPPIALPVFRVVEGEVKSDSEKTDGAEPDAAKAS